MKVEGLAEISSPHERTTMYLLANGARLPVAHLPGWSEGMWEHGRAKPQAHEIAKVVRDALSALATVDSLRRSAAADPTLSKVGRITRVEPQIAPALAAVQRAQEQMAHLAVVAAAEERRVYTPKALARDDLVGGLLDQELRNYARSRNPSQKGALIGEMAADIRLLEAIVRAPIGLGTVNEYAGRLWREHVAKTHPEAPQIAHLNEMVSWAGSLLPHLPQHIASTEEIGGERAEQLRRQLG